MKKSFSLTLLVVILVTCWGCGFLAFVYDICAMPEPEISANLQKADAIVVLTGGSERVTTGLELLESGMGKKLFISGVHKKLSLDDILVNQPVPPDIRTCCIVLGYQAGSTIGNAEETRDWMSEQGYMSLRLVTANYHMPRSLLLFHTAMPNVQIIPNPIAPDSVKLYEWWQHPGTINLLATEYCKYLVAFIEVWMRRQ